MLLIVVQIFVKLANSSLMCLKELNSLIFEEPDGLIA